MARIQLICLIFLLFWDASWADDGLCSIKGPGPDGSCSGRDSEGDDESKKNQNSDSLTYHYEDRDLSPEEAEIWAKRFYSKMSYTNDLDWKIRKELDLADDYIVNDAEKAVELFQHILDKEPTSVRAFYAQTRSLQFLDISEYNKEQEEEHYRKIINRFKELLNRPEEEILEPVWNSAASNALTTASVLNDTKVTVEMLKLVLGSRFKDNVHIHQNLLQELLATREFEEAEVVVNKAIEKFPHTQIFHFYKGVILKLTGRKKEGNKLLRSLEIAPADTFDQARDIVNFGYTLMLKGHNEEKEMIYQEASKLHLFISKDQRPLEAVPDIESKPIWSADDVGLTTHDEEFELLTSSWQDIRDEALELAKNLSDWTNVTHHVDKGSWYQFPLFSWSKRRLYHCSVAPKTCELFKSFPASSRYNKGVVRFDLVSPDTHIYPFTGPTNTRLRVNLGLSVPQKLTEAYMRVGRSSYVHWEEGKLVIYDDTYEHEERNDSSEMRLVLVLDVPHPDLSYDMKKNTFTRGGRTAFETY